VFVIGISGVGKTVIDKHINKVARP